MANWQASARRSVAARWFASLRNLVVDAWGRVRGVRMGYAPTVERLSIHAWTSDKRQPTALLESTTLFGKSGML